MAVSGVTTHLFFQRRGALMISFDEAEVDVYLKFAMGCVIMAPSALVLVLLGCEAFACAMSMARDAVTHGLSICKASVVLGREALVDALEREELSYEEDADGALIVRVPVAGGMYQTVYVAPDASEIFSSVVYVGADLRKNRTLARMSPAPGFDVALLRRNGRDALALCARVPRRSKPSHTLNIIRRIATSAHKTGMAP
jgi:hypothetical protein